MKTRSLLCAAAAACFGWIAAAPPALAETVDLTTPGSSGDANNALFYSVNPRPTGTGYIDPFLRIQATDSEHGFNTDAEPPALDAKPGLWTHSLLVSDVPIVTLNGQEYLEFMLDINEVDNDNPATDPAYLLTMHEMHVYVADGGSINDLATLVSKTKVFDLDQGADGDSQVDLSYNPAVGWGTGSGSGDMYAYVPKWATYNADLSRNLYLYSSFGGTLDDSDLSLDAAIYSSSDGFEEWAVEKATVIPLPASVWGGLGLLLALGLRKLRARHA